MIYAPFCFRYIYYKVNLSLCQYISFSFCRHYSTFYIFNKKRESKFALPLQPSSRSAFRTVLPVFSWFSPFFRCSPVAAAALLYSIIFVFARLGPGSVPSVPLVAAVSENCVRKKGRIVPKKVTLVALFIMTPFCDWKIFLRGYSLDYNFIITQFTYYVNTFFKIF